MSGPGRAAPADPGPGGAGMVRWLARGVQEVPESADWLSPAESARIAGLRFPKRRTEVRLARWAAKQAIARVLDLEDDAGTLADGDLVLMDHAADFAYYTSDIGRMWPVNSTFTGPLKVKLSRWSGR